MVMYRKIHFLPSGRVEDFGVGSSPREITDRLASDTFAKLPQYAGPGARRPARVGYPVGAEIRQNGLREPNGASGASRPQ
jgi:hypothetical protein